MKKLLIGLLAVLVLVVAALFVAPPLLSNSLVKSRIVDSVKEATGRDVQIGEVSLAILPSVEVGLSDLKLANAEGLPTPDMLRLGRLDLSLALFPLIGKEVVIDRLVVSDLEVALEVDEAGRANWDFPHDGKGERHGDRDHAGRDDGAPLSDLRLGEVRLENARLAYRDLMSGQTVEVEELNLEAALADIASKLSLTGGLVLNGKPVRLDVGIDTPEALMTGSPAKIAASVAAELVNLRADLDLAQMPQPAVDGVASLDIGSTAALLAWLDRPLPADQPDPGRVRLAASFATEGNKVLLQEAVVEGESLDLKATGSFEAAGEVNKLALQVESGVLDIDRYLPPPSDAPDDMDHGMDRGVDRGQERDGRRPPLEGLPDRPFDLAGLRQTETDVTVAIAGIRLAGYEVGPIGLALQSAGGKLRLDLNQLALYGGGVTGHLGLDGAGEALDVEVDFALDQVDLGALTAVGSPGQAPVTGVASGSLTANGQGVSPRALMQDLKGSLAFKAGGIDVADAAGLSAIDLAVELPGLAQSPSVTGAVVYNQRRVALALGFDPLDKVMAGETFALEARVESDLLRLSYNGGVQQQPVPGLDGAFAFEVTSVGELAAWLGQPLPDGQPDPGPLAVEASLTADGEAVALERASISGKAVAATASGRFDVSGAIPRFQAALDVTELDLNAYLPASDEAAPAEPASDGPAGWSEEPIGAFGQLDQAEGQADVTLAKVLYREVRVERAAAKVTLAGGVLTANVAEVLFAPGRLTASAVVDGSGEAGAITYEATLQGVEAKPFLQSFAGSDILSGKLDFETTGSARGASQKDIVSSLNGSGRFAFLDGAIEGIDLAGTLRNVGQLGVASSGDKPKTDFTELSGSFTITDGLVENSDLKMLAPLVRVTGAGQVPLPPRTLDYRAEAKLVASLEGQGGSDALAGLPIPVHAHGPWDGLSYDVDYATMFNAADPAALANLPANIAEKAAGFGIDLPIPGLGGGEGGEGGVGGVLEGVLEGVTGGAAGGESSGGDASGGAGGALGGALEGLLGGGTQGGQGAEGSEATSEDAAPAEEAPAEPALPVPEVGEQLKNLFQ